MNRVMNLKNNEYKHKFCETIDGDIEESADNLWNHEDCIDVIEEILLTMIH